MTHVLYRCKSKLYAQPRGAHAVAFTVATAAPQPHAPTLTARIRHFLRAVHITKEELCALHRAIIAYTAAAGIEPFDNTPAMVEPRLRSGIVFYTYRFLPNVGRGEPRPTNVFYINTSIETNVLAALLHRVSPNLFVRRLLEPHCSLAENLGFHVPVAS